MIDLGTTFRLSVEEVPPADREWVERVIASPLNRYLQQLADSFQRIPLANLNVQVLEWRGLPPTSTRPVEIVSTLAGKCMGITPPIYVRAIRGGSEEVVAEGGGLSTPLWSEVTPQGGGSRIRITGQAGGLTATQNYVIRWLAYGA